MAVEISIPRLGWSMEEGVFAGWLKQPGDVVKAGDPLFMLEGEKATQEIESIGEGVLHLAPDTPAAGQTVLVGRAIGQLCAAGEKPVWNAAPAAAAAPVIAAPAAAIAPAAHPVAAAPAPRAADRESQQRQPSRPSAGEPTLIPLAASPTVRRLARQLGVDLSRVEPAWPGGRVADHDVVIAAVGASAAAVTPGSRVIATPRARRLARERGVDLATIRGSGARGRVRERDVPTTPRIAPPTGRSPSPANGAVPAGAIPVTATRRTIARQMVKSRQETVPVTLTAWADATALLAERARLKEAHGSAAASLNDILLKLVADLLVVHPLLASRWEETHLVPPAADKIDIGLAVDAPGGLVVPVVRDVGRSALADVARQSRDLIERARTGRLAVAEMQGGVFTLTSLGSFGIEFFNPVINWPESAILGLGVIRQQPVPLLAGQGGFVFQPQLPLSLTFDHRVVDGAPAARFLGELVRRIGGV
ncbi:MAG: dihydrolipoamide acetyltransferase family protein [Planctomycetia bacterium]|nr:dihydrolipoamide acetyltransferase family protein [Planctomycetia bacterium]